MQSHHDHSNSYNGKHLIGAFLQFKSLVPFVITAGGMDHSDLHGAVEATDSFWFTGSRNKETVGLG